MNRAQAAVVIALDEVIRAKRGLSALDQVTRRVDKMRRSELKRLRETLAELNKRLETLETFCCDMGFRLHFLEQGEVQ